MEVELLLIVNILYDYRTMLVGFPVIVHTDYKNINNPMKNSLRVKRWQLLLSKYIVNVFYVKVNFIIGAGACLRMHNHTRI